MTTDTLIRKHVILKMKLPPLSHSFVQKHKDLTIFLHPYAIWKQSTTQDQQDSINTYPNGWAVQCIMGEKGGNMSFCHYLLYPIMHHPSVSIVIIYVQNWLKSHTNWYAYMFHTLLNLFTCFDINFEETSKHFTWKYFPDMLIM